MQKKTCPDKTQEFLRTCQNHHLKITPQRVAIYNALLKLDTHPTADAVFKIVKTEYPNINRYGSAHYTTRNSAKLVR